MQVYVSTTGPAGSCKESYGSHVPFDAVPTRHPINVPSIILTRSPRAEEEARSQEVDVASHMHDIYPPPPISFASCGQTVVYQMRCIQTAGGRRHFVRPILTDAINVCEPSDGRIA